MTIETSAASERSDATSGEAAFTPIRYADGHLELLDQTRLPGRRSVAPLPRRRDCGGRHSPARGARRAGDRRRGGVGARRGRERRRSRASPTDAAHDEQTTSSSSSEAELAARFDDAWQLLAGTRPTAVNLRWALDQGRRVWQDALPRGVAAARAALAEWAARLQAEDLAANERMGEHGAALFAAGDRALTHCNAGALATAGYGTAIGVLTSAWRTGRLANVWVDETRPLLQGARLTAWELSRLGIPYRLITDNSAGALISRGMVDRIVVGADRIARNGDTANKIGTYPLAVLASRHAIPFYVAAPLSTVDLATPNGDAIPIEERRPEEVVALHGTRTAPPDAAALNLAFDVTPAELITAIITEAGVLEPPYETSLEKAVREAAARS